MAGYYKKCSDSCILLLLRWTESGMCFSFSYKSRALHNSATAPPHHSKNRHLFGPRVWGRRSCWSLSSYIHLANGRGVSWLMAIFQDYLVLGTNAKVEPYATRLLCPLPPFDELPIWWILCCPLFFCPPKNCGRIYGRIYEKLWHRRFDKNTWMKIRVINFSLKSFFL